MVFHSTLVPLTRKIPVLPISEHRIEGYWSGFNIQHPQEGQIFLENSLELALVIPHGLTRLLGVSLNLIQSTVWESPRDFQVTSSSDCLA